MMVAMGLDPKDFQQDEYNDPDLAGIGGKHLMTSADDDNLDDD
jgi:hypothetical protein